MIMLTNFRPTNCPNCGRTFKWSKYGEQDFFAGASHTCSCGMSYQYAETPHLLEASKASGGDMARYVSE